MAMGPCVPRADAIRNRKMRGSGKDGVVAVCEPAEEGGAFGARGGARVAFERVFRGCVERVGKRGNEGGIVRWWEGARRALGEEGV